jgi:hypothetical protein
MSWQFESLTTTSELPDWISEEALSEQWLLLMGGTHGEEREQIEYVRSRMGYGYFSPGLLPIIANHLAAEHGQRSISTTQLMSQYPGNFDGDTNESRTAAGITWLIDQLNPERVVIDCHENSCGNRYFQIGSKVMPAALTAGRLLGHTNVWVYHWSKFSKLSPFAVQVEEATPRRQVDRIDYFAETDKQLQHIAKLGYKGLTAFFHDEAVSEQLHYLDFAAEPLLVNPRDRTPNWDILDILPELEGLGVENGDMTTITLSEKVQKILGLPPRRQYYAVSGGYDNRSAPVDNSTLGLSDDVERKLAWGDILMDRLPPRVDPISGALVFD